ncbi:MAG: polyphosphate kinase 1 [Lentisphaeria bacterium]|nr:polyphosphate kinase 1 [Lentisphaeria bacterium]
MITDRELFISRELSWLQFNDRVLEEACDHSKSAAERLKFLVITENNLDEFFMVRVAGLRKLLQAGHDFPDPAGLRPSVQLEKVRRMVLDFTARRRRCLEEEILPELEKQGIRLAAFRTLSADQQKMIAQFFEERIKPVLTPLVVDDAHPFPLLAGGALEIACELELADGSKKQALVEVPEVLDRFQKFSGGKTGTFFIPLEEIICGCLDMLFPACRISDFFLFRITRDMDFSIVDDSVEDLLESISHQLELRQKRGAIRLEISGAKRGELFFRLCRQLELETLFIYETEGFLNLKNFLCSALLTDRTGQPGKPAPIPGLPEHLPVFEALKKSRTVMIAPPYQSFSPVVRLLEEAAADPQVLAVKQTLYRVSGNSPVVHALQRAAENGKQVTVVVELKARFDEKNNIAWARALEESGAHVVYGIPGLKIHGKALLIVRREEGGALQRYVHLATGNYNDKTARIYTDIGLLSIEKDLALDVEKFFNTVTCYTARSGDWQQIRVAPFDLRQTFSELIEREIALAESGKRGLIRAKMNSLSDKKMIRLLHKAADAGVELQLLVRGICCFRPQPGRENVRIISIVDRFLEHSRIFHFGNGGKDLFYLSSADWMTRNLDRRVEILFPVTRPELQNALKNILDCHFADDCKSRRLESRGIYTAPRLTGTCRSQEEIQRLFQNGRIFTDC